jgi:hypothetical protein
MLTLVFQDHSDKCCHWVRQERRHGGAQPQREAWTIRSNCSYAYIKESFLPLGHEAFCPSSWKDLLKPDDV